MSIGQLPVGARVRRRVHPRFLRLGLWLVLGALLRLMTVTAEGTATQHLLVVRMAWKSAGLIGWLVAGAAVWALLEVGRARGFGAEVSRRTAGVRGQWRSFIGAKTSRLLFLLVVVVAAIIVPQLLSEFYQRVLVDQVAVFVLLAVGLNVVVGWAGLLDLGYVGVLRDRRVHVRVLPERCRPSRRSP